MTEFVDSINDIAAPCSLRLRVYTPITIYDDTEEVDWEVSSDPAHVQPWLLAPRQYAEQEIDPIRCTASIGTVEVGVIDVETVPGDQSSGWMTARVHDILGRRCRLERYIDDDIGWVVIADGPAGVPRMDSSYAAYRWPIRDTRETERRLVSFAQGGSSAIVPRGSVYGFGEYTDDEGDHVLLQSVLGNPATGTYQISAAGSLQLGIVNFAPLHFTPGMDSFANLDDAKLLMDEEGQNAVQISQLANGRWAALKADVLWRVLGDTEWNKARMSAPDTFRQPFLGTSEARLNGVGDPLLCANYITLFVADDIPDGFPTSGEITMEVVVRYRGFATEGFPYYVEGTLGDVLKNLYDGVYSIVPTTDVDGFDYDPDGLDNPDTVFLTRIKYDPTAFDNMTERVVLRQTAIVSDSRAFSEEFLYSPSGWMPTLDNDGLISPTSRNRPDEVDGDLIVDDVVAVPSPDWQTGERTLSMIQFNYPRFFIPDSGSTFELMSDGLARRDVSIAFQDANSELRYGPQIEEFDCSAFAAIGDEDGLSIAGQVEQTSEMAQVARFELLDRYAAGAQSIGVLVKRFRIPNVRVGDWIPWSLLHLPDQLSGIRGSVVDAAQIISIRDDDCTWRRLTLEASQASEGPPGVVILLEVLDDDLSPGTVSLLEIIDDTESGS